MTEAPLSPGYPASVVGGELRLPKPPGVIRQFWARHPRLVDWLVAILYFVPTFAATLAGGFLPEPRPPAAILAGVGGVVGTAAALVFVRRSRPWLLTAVAWIAALCVYPFSSVDVLPMVFALYALAVYRSTRDAWIGFAGSVVVATISTQLAVFVQGRDSVTPFGAPPAASATQFTVLLLIATLVGVTVGNRRRYLNALIDRAHDLARERDQQAQLATALERSRIAREMHDIVSHSLTVMVTLADGSAVTTARDPGRAAEAMGHVAETGRAALADMRRMLGVLAEPGAPVDELAPQPGAAAMPALVESFRTAGLPVHFTTIGAPVGDPNLQLTVYRIVQEGLTNALRYAATAHRVDVTVDHADGIVRVDVVDDAPPSSHAPAAGGAGAAATATPAPAATTSSAPEIAGGGNGLVGMRERVAVYGGALEAGPRPVRGWRVHAVLRAETTPPHPKETE
ncbi:sensor histidine kinase [Agromyces sp. NPDC055520]